MFFSKSDIRNKKKPPAGMLATEVRIGDAPKPTFSIKSIENQKNPEINTLTDRSKKTLFPSLLIGFA